MEKDEGLYRRFLSLAVVLVLQNVVTLSVNLADNMMLGAYSETALAGVAAVNQIQFVYQQLLHALGDGVVIVGSQYWGKNQTVPMKRLASAAMRFGLVLSIALFAVVSLIPYRVMGIFTRDSGIIAEGARYLNIIRFTYLFFAVTQILLATLRSVETVKIAFKLSVLTLFVNCGINYVLINGHFGAPEMGVKGAAIGTLAARILECIVLLLYISKRERKLNLKWRGLLKSYDSHAHRTGALGCQYGAADGHSGAHDGQCHRSQQCGVDPVFDGEVHGGGIGCGHVRHDRKGSWKRRL